MKPIEALVVGGGPAGSACALELARRGRSVALLERSRYARRRYGEVLIPELSHLLNQLGLKERFQALGPRPSPSVDSAWGGNELYVQPRIFNPYGSGWHVDRCAFDAMLAQAAQEAGALVWRQAHVVSATRAGKGWRISVRRGGAREVIHAPFLIDATGHGGRLARSLGASWISLDSLVAVVRFLRPPPEQDSSLATMGSELQLESSPAGWWYTAALPEQALVAAFMTDADLLQASGLNAAAYWQRALEGSEHSARRMAGLAFDGKVRTRVASTGRLNEMLGPGWLAVGDAAYAFGPLSGTGVYRAMHMGLSAARELDESPSWADLVLQGYPAEREAEFARNLVLRAHSYGMERRWPEAPFWSRRQASQG